MSKIRSIVAALAAGLFVSPALGQAFTYQGVAEFDGSPAQGTLDVRFTLFDAAQEGDELADVTVDDVPVSDGVFTVEVDFEDSDLFNFPGRYLLVSIRDGSGVTPFSDLLPRQPLTDAPRAFFAEFAASSLDQPWLVTPIGLNFGFSNGSETVLINRGTRVTDAEFFGFSFPGIGFGGMYIDSENSVLGQPFYGYSGGGDATAYHGFNNSTNTWSLVTRGNDQSVTTALSVDGDRSLSVNGEVKAGGYTYTNPKAQELVLSPIDFDYPSAFGSVVITASNGDKWVETTSVFGTHLRAPVRLPTGAVVTGMRIYYIDNKSGFASLRLERRGLSAELQTLVCEFRTEGNSPEPNDGFTPSLDSTPFDPAGEFMWITMSSEHVSNYRLRGAVVEYTVTEVE